MKRIKSQFVLPLLSVWSLAVLVGLVTFAPTVHATTITVDTLDGGATTIDGHCSFSEALTAANTDTAVDTCPAGNGADEIVFGIPGEVVITAELPYVQKEVVINGHSNGTTLNFNGANYGLVIAPPPIDLGGGREFMESIDATINDIEIINSADNTYGAVRVYFYLDPGDPAYPTTSYKVTLNNVYVHNNTGNGIYYHATWFGYIDSSNAPEKIHLEINNSVISDNNMTGIVEHECGFKSDWSLYINNSLIKNNQAGGVELQCGHLVINGSSIVNNTRNESGAGILVLNGNMGGQRNKLELTNVTIAGNQSVGDTTKGGGLFVSSEPNPYSTVTPEVHILNATIAENTAAQGAGFASDVNAVINLVNTVVANNSGSTQCAFTGSLATNTNNASSDDSCGFSLENVDPKLQGLADNGGKALLGPNGTLGNVLTMFPVADSPLLSAADDTLCPVTDEIGTTRPQGDGCDIGAIEFFVVPTPTPTPTPTVTPTPTAPLTPTPETAPGSAKVLSTASPVFGKNSYWDAEENDGDAATAESSQTVSGIGLPGATILVQNKSGNKCITTVDADGYWSCEIPGGQEAAEYTVTVLEESQQPNEGPSFEAENTRNARITEAKSELATGLSVTRLLRKNWWAVVLVVAVFVAGIIFL